MSSDAETRANRRALRMRALQTDSDDDSDDDKIRGYFPNCAERDLFASSASWPVTYGCMGILFTSRSGSTFLSRELEKRFVLGQIRESFNLPILRSRAQKSGLESPAIVVRHTIRMVRERGWFAFKAGTPGLIVAERSGFVDAYLQQIRFMILLRRDIVAQAVSLAKAKATGIFHSSQAARVTPRPLEYSFADIAHGVQKVVNGVRRISNYALATERPCRVVFYEDFCNGDFACVDRICTELELPRRKRLSRSVREVEKIGDHINDEWCTVFRSQMDSHVRSLVDEYARLMERDEQSFRVA